MRFGISAATAKRSFYFYPQPARRGESGGRGKEVNVGKKGGEGGKGGYLTCLCCEMKETGPFDEMGPE